MLTGAIKQDAQRWWHLVLPEELPERLQALLNPAATIAADLVRCAPCFSLSIQLTFVIGWMVP